MSSRKKILWLVSWYPNKYNWFDGDFIQRHAKAAAVHHDVHVLFVKQAEDQTRVEEVITNSNGLTEQIIYLPKQKGWRSSFQNLLAWQRCYKTAIKKNVVQERPVFVHVHIPWKVGLIALWAKKEYKLTYLLTEHWGIYNDVAEDNIHTKSVFFRQVLKRIIQTASVFISVSHYLGKGVNKTLVKKEFSVIPNVVDTDLFYRTEKKHERFTFLHVSNMVPLKNVEAILRAFDMLLKQTKSNAEFVFIGNSDETYPRLAEELGLLPSVSFKGEVAYAVVAEEMRRCHVFVLASHIENSPCVIGEALCCGLPVIATAVGGVPELIDKENGRLVPPQDVVSLAAALTEVFYGYSTFNTTEIAVAAQKKFGTLSISAAFATLYNRP